MTSLKEKSPLVVTCITETWDKRDGRKQKEREGLKEVGFAKKKTRFRTAVMSFLIIFIYLEKGNFRRQCWELILLFYFGLWPWSSGHPVWMRVSLQNYVCAFESQVRAQREMNIAVTAKLSASVGSLCSTL